MSSDLLNLTMTDDGASLLISGRLNEKADFNSLGPIEGDLIVDFADMKSVDEDGLEKWYEWILATPENLFIFKNLKSFMIDKFNLYNDCLPANYRVDSFYIPYVCDSCGNSSNRLLTRGTDYFDYQPLPDLETIECSCGQKQKLLVESSTFFTFLSEADFNRYALFNVFQEAIMVIDEENVIHYANDFVAQILDMSITRLTSKGKKINEVFNFESEGLFSREDKEVASVEEAQILESAYTTKKGKEGSFQISTLMDPASPRNRKRWIIYMHDTSLEIMLANKYRSEQDEKKQKMVELEKSHVEKAEIYKKATTDDMTGLHNYRAFIERCKIELQKCKRNKDDLGFVILDIDLFKKFNDTYGHQQGDEVLRTVAKALTEVGRESDFVGRYGGEEFVMIFPNTDFDGTLTIMEKARENLASKQVPMLIDPSKPPLSVTATFGGLSLNGEQLADFDFDEKGLQKLIDAADQNLYEGKGNGRNQCVCTRWEK